MKKLFLILIVVFVSCKNEAKINSEVAKSILINNNDIQLEIHNYNGLEPYLNKTDDKIYVVNFWATWCAPCVKELPYFETLNKNFKNKNVEVVLVSLDFPNQYENKLKPFIKKYDLQSKILVLDDVDMNSWIPKINENWDGAIPVTIIYNKDKRKFYDKTFTYIELENELQQFLN